MTAVRRPPKATVINRNNLGVCQSCGGTETTLECALCGTPICSSCANCEPCPRCSEPPSPLPDPEVTAREHAAADARCGRTWVCMCGACRQVRGKTMCADCLHSPDLHGRRGYGSCRHGLIRGSVAALLAGAAGAYIDEPASCRCHRFRVRPRSSLTPSKGKPTP